MSFKYKDFFYIAQELTGKTPVVTPSEEAKLRVAIGRSYYAVFLEAREYLELYTPLILPHDGSEHGLVKEQFFLRGQTDGKFKRIWQNLEFLHTLRKKADYGDVINNLPNLTQNALQRAQDALDKLGELK
jgi:hypothetical protein